VSAGGLVHNGRVIGALGRRSIRQTFRRPQFLAPIVLFPSLFLAANTGGASQATELPGFPDVGFLDFQLAGSMLQSTLLVGVSGGIALALDIERGFIDRLLAAPVARSAMVLGRLVATAVLGLVAALWFLAVGAIFGASFEGGPAGVVAVLVLIPLASLAFGGLGAALALRSGRASVVQGVFPLVFVILFLSTAFFPRNLLQEPAATVAALNPLSLIVDGLREAIVSGVTPDAMLRALGGIALVAVISFGLAALALRARLRAA